MDQMTEGMYIVYNRFLNKLFNDVDISVNEYFEMKSWKYDLY